MHVQHSFQGFLKESVTAQEKKQANTFYGCYF